MRYKKLRERYTRDKNMDEQFHISFSDLFAGMIGVIMIFIVYFYSSVAMSNKLNVKPTFEEAMESNITRIQNGADSYYESIYFYEDYISIAKFKKKIPLNEIEDSIWLQNYLKGLYADKGEVLAVIGSGNHLSYTKFNGVLYKLSKKNKRMLSKGAMYRHENCEFILNKKEKEECLKKWGAGQ
ncbi:MAG TPA: hypothetical protein EYG73_01975 [Arcobacter sp.]|nr:hypothetical protein [Arcobacter sp.]